MSNAEELLNSMSEEIPVHSHPVPDTDTYFVIDPVTRKIENTSPEKNVIMQYDHNSERYTFELPRYIDGHDMLECNSITVNVDNIEVGVEEPSVNSDAPDMTDLRIHPTDPEKVISSWLISRNSTQLAGILSFHIEYKCIDSSGNVVYEWSTDVYDEIEIRARKKNGEAAVAPHSDLLEQWRTRIFGAGDSVMANIAAEGEAQVAAVKDESEIQQEAVELKGAQTLDSIPEDYTEIDAMADKAVRTKCDAIVCEAAGESIVLKDSSNDYIRGLKLLGKSSQVVTTGKNLFKTVFASGYSETVKGVTFTVNPDKSIHVKGTPTAAIAYNIFEGEVFPIGNYFISGAPATAGQKFRLQVNLNVNGTEQTGGVDMGSGSKFTVDESVTSLRGYIYVASDAGGVNGTFYPQIELGAAATNYEPYTGGKPSPNPDYPQEIVSVENPVARVHGKNILEFSHAYNYLPEAATLVEELENGIIVKGADGAVPGGSTYSSGWYQVCYNNRIPLKAGTYVTFSADYTVLENPHATTANISLHFSAKNSYSLTDSVLRPVDGVKTRISRTVLIEKDEDYFFTVGLNSCTVRIENIQLELSDTATEYEPFIRPQTIALHRTLPGIPVTADGNYTDEDGRQWICDEVDLERGVYIQRVIKKTFSASVNEAWRVYNVHSEKTHTAYQESKLCADMKVFTGTAADTGELLSNKYVAVPLTAVYDSGTQGISVSNVSPAIRMCVDACQGYSVEEFRVWLKENPFELIYPLATPIETPLTAEEITVFKTLHTNYPNTTILNDAGAWMNVKYNADTKIYFNNLPKATDKQVQAAVDAWLNQHFASAEGVSF